ncbi:MAG TPA: SPOR domain-containing protein [Sphingomicrobium sp.]|nr:SPOR domain-containing protein [Sphingomicrobium sp.]
MMRNLVLSAALLAAAAPAPAQSVKAGIEAWQQSDYPAAVAIWRPLAEAGDADAAFNLGQAYRLGRGVPLNLAAAQTWFERAAREGHVDAQTTLGLLLFDIGNRVAGLRWLKSAAERGEPRALLIYGTALFNGEGIPRDPVLAYAYVSRAAAQGLAPAKRTLAEMDQLLPLEQRQKGVALAQQKAAADKPPAVKPAPPAATRKAAAKPPAAKSPVAEVSKPRATAAAAGPGWRLQLGAFSTRAAAEALFRKLSASGMIAGAQPAYVTAGKITRLQVGSYPSRSAAAAACRGLIVRGQPCFPVATK